MENLSELSGYVCLAGNALCFVAILVVACWKGRRHAQLLSFPKSEPGEAFYDTRAVPRVQKMGSEQHLARALLQQ
jgi:hypothetical protein